MTFTYFKSGTVVFYWPLDGGHERTAEVDHFNPELGCYVLHDQESGEELHERHQMLRLHDPEQEARHAAEEQARYATLAECNRAARNIACALMMVAGYKLHEEIETLMAYGRPWHIARREALERANLWQTKG